jgi:hypothetical protein
LPPLPAILLTNSTTPPRNILGWGIESLRSEAFVGWVLGGKKNAGGVGKGGAKIPLNPPTFAEGYGGQALFQRGKRGWRKLSNIFQRLLQIGGKLGLELHILPGGGELEAQPAGVEELAG